MTWKDIWKIEHVTKEVRLSVFETEEGEIANAELHWTKKTRRRTYMDSKGISPSQLLELCEALQPIHTKLLKKIADENVKEIKESVGRRR